LATVRSSLDKYYFMVRGMERQLLFYRGVSCNPSIRDF